MRVGLFLLFVMRDVVIQLRQDDGHVDVAPLVGSALGVGPVHHHLGPAAETWRDYAFVFSDEPEGFIARKHFFFSCHTLIGLAIINTYLCEISCAKLQKKFKKKHFGRILTRFWAQMNHGDRWFEVNSTNSFKNLSP